MCSSTSHGDTSPPNHTSLIWLCFLCLFCDNDRLIVHHPICIVFGSESGLAMEHIWPLRRQFCCQEISVECTLLFLVEALYVQYKLSCCPPSSPLLYTETKRQREWIIHLFTDIHASSIQCDCFLSENTLFNQYWHGRPAWLEFTGQIYPLEKTGVQMRNQLWATTIKLALMRKRTEQIQNLWFLSCLIWLLKAQREGVFSVLLCSCYSVLLVAGW